MRFIKRLYWLISWLLIPALVDAATPPPVLPAGVVKWHPGHYTTLLPERTDEAYMGEVMRELAAVPPLRGVQIRYTWAELEPEKGRYDFQRIERDLRFVASTGKQLFVLLQTKSFDTTRPAIPAYLFASDGAYEIDIPSDGRERRLPRVGQNIALWKDDVRERLILLGAELGRRFNAHPNLEGVAITESAPGRARFEITPAMEQRLFENLLVFHRNLRRAFPNTVTMQFLNFPKRILPWVTAGLREAGVGMGGPDILLEDQSLLTGAYTYYPKLAGSVPLGPSVQHENYLARKGRGPFDPPTVTELYDFARGPLRANYLFWTRRIYGHDSPYLNVLELMKSSGFPAGVAGGLAEQCPTAYAGCVH